MTIKDQYQANPITHPYNRIKEPNEYQRIGIFVMGVEITNKASGFLSLNKAGGYSAGAADMGGSKVWGKINSAPHLIESKTEIQILNMQKIAFIKPADPVEINPPHEHKSPADSRNRGYRCRQRVAMPVETMARKKARQVQHFNQRIAWC